MSIYFDKDKQRYRFGFKKVIGGKEKRISKLLPAGWSKSQAEAYDQQTSSRLYAEATGIEKPVPGIEEALSLYLDHKIPHLKNGKKSAQDLSHLIPYIEGQSLDSLGAIAKKYARENEHLAPATVKNRLAYLKAAVRYAYKHHDLGEKDYTDKMILPKVRNKRHVYIKQDEFHTRLLANCRDPETRAILTLAFYTGMRWRSEILTLKSEQILQTEGQAWLSIPDSKNGSPHMIPVHPNAMWALQFVPFKWGDSYYYARFWAARRAAGMEHVRIHDERHSLASALLSSGATLGEVGSVLNHDSVQSSERYSHLYPERIRELLSRLPLVAENAPPTPKTRPKSKGRKDV